MAKTETKTNTLRQAENNVHIEGLLLENGLEEVEVNDQDHGKIPAIRGEVDVEVAENEVHTISFFMKSLKKDGTANGIYKSLTTVMDEYKSVASVGREEADRVRINSAEIKLNEYYAPDGKLRSFPQIKSNFINRLKESDVYEPQAAFKTEAVVKNVTQEMKGEDETGRLKVNTYIPLFSGQIIPFTFTVSDEDAVNYIEENYEPRSTVSIYGDIVNFKEVKKVVEKAAFGKDHEKITTKTVREYVITGGSEPYDEDNALSYNMDSIKTALTEREVYLENLLERSKEKQKDGKKPAVKKKESKGFNTKEKKNDKKVDIDEDDLPF